MITAQSIMLLKTISTIRIAIEMVIVYPTALAPTPSAVRKIQASCPDRRPIMIPQTQTPRFGHLIAPSPSPEPIP
jgi:hypothetical protein